MNLIGVESHYLTIKHGNTLQLTFDCNEPNSEDSLDLTGHTARLQLRFLRNNALIIDATTDNGLLLIDNPESGLIKLSVPALEMMHSPLGRHKFDLEVTTPDNSVFSSGMYVLDILKSVTAEYEQGTPGTPGYSGIYYPFAFTAANDWTTEIITATEICRVLNLTLAPSNNTIYITVEIINIIHAWGLLKVWSNLGTLFAEWIIMPTEIASIGDSIRIHSINMST